MKLIVINNNVMIQKENGYYIHHSYAPFLEELAQLNEKVLFYQFGMKMDGDSPLADYCVNNRNFEIKVLSRSRYKVISYLRAYLIGIWLIMQYDMLYLFFPTNFHFLGFIAKILNKKLGLYLRGQLGIESKLSRVLYQKADITFTVSPMFTQMVEKFGGKADTIRPMITISNDDIVLHREYKSKSKYKILFLGRIEFDKGLRELVHAVKMLKNVDIINFHLEIVGDGSHLDALKQLCIELGVNDMVTFQGNQSGYKNIKHFFSQADIYILPTYHEGFPRTLYEAMIFGTPIITTLVGGIPYLMKDRENCLVIQPKSVESIYEVLASVLRDYEQMIPIAYNGTKTISEYLNAHSLSHAQQLTKYINDVK